MSIKQDKSGRRSVQVEVEVPGTPEQVWQAIATGPGVSSWFVSTKIDGRVGGKLECDFGGGMVSGAQITEWQPPRRLVAEDQTWLQGGPSVATEWTIEARANGTCLVRVVHSLFASTDQWDNQLENTEQGWPSFFRVLRFYLTHHAGQRSATMTAMAMGSGTKDSMWTTLLGAVGAPAPRAGQKVNLQAPGATRLAATIERVEHTGHSHGLELRISEPVPGIVLTGVFECMGMLMANFQAYFYGDRAEKVANDRERWQAWLSQAFPSAQTAPPTA